MVSEYMSIYICMYIPSKGQACRGLQRVWRGRLQFPLYLLHPKYLEGVYEWVYECTSIWVYAYLQAWPVKTNIPIGELVDELNKARHHRVEMICCMYKYIYMFVWMDVCIVCLPYSYDHLMYSITHTLICSYTHILIYSYTLYPHTHILIYTHTLMYKTEIYQPFPS